MIIAGTCIGWPCAHFSYHRIWNHSIRVDLICHWWWITITHGAVEGISSTNDYSHNRRAKGSMHPDIYVNSEGEFIGRKDCFMTRSLNRRGLIKLIAADLQKWGCTTFTAEGDADVLIAQTAVDSSQHCETTNVGEDTDLILLLFLTDVESCQGLQFKSDGTWDVCGGTLY